MARTKSDNGILLTPVGEISHAAALNAVIEPGLSIHDMRSIVGPAMAFAGHCMAPAVGHLALMALEGQTMFGDWQIESAANASANVIDMRLSRPDRPGAWHVGVSFDPVPTPDEATRQAEQDAADTLRHANMTEDQIMDDMIKSILSDKDDVSDPDRYRPARAGDRVGRVCGTALCAPEGQVGMLAGPPPRIPRSDTAKLRDPIRPEGKLYVHWSGMALDVKPVRMIEDGIMLSKGESHDFKGAELLSTLSEIIVDMDLEDIVRQRAIELTGVAIWSSNVGKKPECEELAYCLIHDRGGKFDDACRDVVANINAYAFAQDMHRLVPRLRDLSGRMQEAGLADGDRTYDSNDGRQTSWVTQSEATDDFHIKTQNGRFRLELGYMHAHAWRLGEPDVLVGKFMLSPEVTVPMWQPLIDPDEIVYSARNVRDLNEIIQSLETITCCFNEDHPKPVDDDATPTF
jgi:hypothetical protein